jgi:3-oxoacyl-[acyl-carrier protein] reductase
MLKSEKPLIDLISLKGKWALITGSASGIGRSIANRFAEAGANLILVDIDETKLAKVIEELKVWNVMLISKKIDLSQKHDIDKLWKEIKGNEPDILVNNAGIYPFRDFLEVDEAFYKNVHAINLEAVLWMCQYMIRANENKGGIIINVSSIEAVLPFKKGMIHYDASKAGVIGLTRGLAKDFSEKGFRVNALIPGGIATPGTKGAAMEFFKGNFSLAKTGYDFLSRLPIGRWGKPDEVARAAIFLASDLSSYITGAILVVDGGFLSA